MNGATEERGLVIRQATGEIVNADATPTRLVIAEQFAKSGYFSDIKAAAQAFVKIQYGAEHGIGPAASMMGVQVIQGKPAPSAGLMAALIKRSGKYNYHVIEWSVTQCILEFFEGGKSAGKSSFSIEDARKAGVLSGGNKNMWEKYPRNMLFARALSNGARVYCPDVFFGRVYTAEELGETVNEEGDVIDVVPAPVKTVEIEPSPTLYVRRTWLDSIRTDTKRLKLSADEALAVATVFTDGRVKGREDFPRLPDEEVEALAMAFNKFRDHEHVTQWLDRETNKPAVQQVEVEQLQDPEWAGIEAASEESTEAALSAMVKRDQQQVDADDLAF